MQMVTGITSSSNFTCTRSQINYGQLLLETNMLWSIIENVTGAHGQHRYTIQSVVHA